MNELVIDPAASGGRVILDGPVVLGAVVLDGTGARLLDAASACIARVGVSKTTLDDVARDAGCSRATLYRYFPGKPALLGALVTREAAVLAAHLEAAAADAGTLEDAVVAIVLAAAGAVSTHPALQFLMVAEPDLLLPHLAFDGADRVLAAGAQVIAPALSRFFGAGEPGADLAARAGEWLARMILSYVCSPTDSVDLSDPRSVRLLVGDFIVPGLHSVLASSRG